MADTTMPLQTGRAALRLDDESGELRARTYRLTVVEGPDAKKAIDLEGPLRVGSHPDAGFRLSDPSVSRYHLELEPRGEGVRVRDLESRNGTLLGNVKLTEALVEDEVTLKVGKTVLRLHVAERGVKTGTPKKFGDALAEAPSMRKLFGVLEKVAPTDSTVLLLGETGTGKDVLARAIHQASPRAAGPFEVVDCGAIAGELIESELFGHVKGSFTGANSDRKGHFLEAHGGTLFLDEIGELPLELQPKLLRVLETGTVKRVGESKRLAVDVRVVAATHRDLLREVEAGRFRRDLYFRLAVVPIRIPSLRERPEDLPALVAKFLADGGRADLYDRAMSSLAGRSFEGNVRELRNAVERLCAGVDELGLEDSPGPGATGASSTGGAARPFKEAKEEMVDRFTKEYLERLLGECGGNLSEMARRAGLARHHLRSLLDKHGLRGGS